MRFWLIWIAAFLCALVAGVLLYLTPSQSRIAADQALDGDLIFIGSSLTRNAVPAETKLALNGGGNLKISRYTLSRIAENEALDLLEKAIAARPKRIFLEINPFAIDLTPPFDWTGLTAKMILAQYRVVRRKVARSALDLIAVPKPSLQNEDWPEDPRFDLKPEDLERVYPFHLKSSAEIARLKTIVINAKKTGVDIVFTSFPRAQTAHDYLGDTVVQDTSAHLGQLAGVVELPIYIPATHWPDSFFHDQAHLNPAGRERFLSEFSIWFKGQM